MSTPVYGRSQYHSATHASNPHAAMCAGRSRAKFLLSLLATLFLASLLAAVPRTTAAQGTPGPNLESPVRGYAKHRVLIQPRAGLSEAELEKILSKHGAKKRRHLRRISVHVIELPQNVAELTVARAMRTNRLIKFAELDMAIAPAFVPNDTYYAQSWHLPKINGPQAWDTTNGAGVIIAVLDTGVNVAHPDLAGKIAPGWNVFDNNANTADVHGHGTKVAGTAMASGNNGLGVAGVAFGAKVMPIRISDPAGYAYFSDMAEGITWAADNGARIASISYQGAAGSFSVQSAAQYLRSKGGVVVVSAGNTGGVQEIAPNDNITAVSATDSGDQRPSWSSYGGYVDVAAPGVSIMTTTREGGYAGFSGTSASAPVIAGAYALMMAANPALLPHDLDQALFSSAADLGSPGKDVYFGAGRVNAAAAVAASVQTLAKDTTPPTVAIRAPTGGAKVNGVVSVDVSATDNFAVARVELYVNGSRIASDANAPYEFAWDTSGLADGEITLTARAFDTSGNQGTSADVKVTVGNDTTPPQVTINPASGSAGDRRRERRGHRQRRSEGHGNHAHDRRPRGREERRREPVLLVEHRLHRQAAHARRQGQAKRLDIPLEREEGHDARRDLRYGDRGTSNLSARATDPAGNVGSASSTVTRY
ncbi:MAG: S8 family serine peptidase [Gammaproteobacteria bacterium]|nr:S8 family serine peptidase [Gammaproteobacteria bacterium]